MDFTTILAQWWNAVAGDWTWILFLFSVSSVVAVKMEDIQAGLFAYFFLGSLLNLVFEMPAIVKNTVVFAFVLFVAGIVYSILKKNTW